MSIKVSSLVWDKFPRGGSEMLCMLAMADWSNDKGGSIHPSIGALARKMRVSESQARRTLHKLIDEGFISVVGNEFGGAPGSTRQYVIHLDRIDTGSTDATPSVDARASMDAQRRVAPMRKTGSTDATQSVIEPSVEPSKNKDSFSESDFANFWTACRDNWFGRTGTKKEARTAFFKLKPSQIDLAEITRLTVLECQSRKRQQKSEGFSPAMKHVCRWIRYEGWQEVNAKPRVASADPLNAPTYSQDQWDELDKIMKECV